MPPTQTRECFITIGATASFKPLLAAATSVLFTTTLLELGYSHMTLQCGPDLEYCSELLQELSQSRTGQPLASQKENHKMELDISGLKIKTFDFNKMGLGQEMRVCQKIEGKRREGVVVCHAGAGTILDAMRISVPIIVVPNPALLDNHQAELAEELQRQGYVVYGDLNDLSSALRETEKKSQARTQWTTKSSHEDERTGGTDLKRKGIGSVVDEELGYEERTRVMEG